MILEKAKSILKSGYVCDHCLGRQFAQLLRGVTNEERGKIIRTLFAMEIDAGEKVDIDLENVENYRFKTFRYGAEKAKFKKCKLCGGLFDNIDDIVKKILTESKKVEFNDFLVGTIIPSSTGAAEENMWEKVGVEYCEPMKAEINRVLGMKLEKILKKEVNFKFPDVIFIVNLKDNSIKLEINSLFIYGEYQKLKTGIPQTKWYCRICHGKGCKHCGGKGKMYMQSIEEIIAKPFLKKIKSIGTRFHGAGREDISARCLGWRPFVLELLKPVKRNIDLRNLREQVNKSKKVQVRKLKFSNKETVRKIKSAKPCKTYRVLVKFENEITKGDLKKLKLLLGEINQKTPTRVSHRRAQKLRKKIVKRIKTKFIDKKHAELEIKTTAGLYVKELVSGDGGRTTPSVTEILKNKSIAKKLDVIKIDKFLQI